MGKIVAISDLHLGQQGRREDEESSLLSTAVQSNRVQGFANELEKFADGDEVELVVVGDFLDLALASMEEALGDMCHLLDALNKIDLKRIVCVIGNHDHHLWALQCQEKGVVQALRNGTFVATPATETTKATGIYKTTPPTGEPFTLFDGQVKHECGSGIDVVIAYPSYQIDVDGRLLYFTHGDLFGGIYTWLSDLFEDLLDERPHDEVSAVVNLPTIELIWWLAGEMGEGLGVDGLAERIYSDIQTGKTGRIRARVKQAVAHELPNKGFWDVWHRVERPLAVNLIMSLLERVIQHEHADGAPQTRPARPGVSWDRNAPPKKTRDHLQKWIAAVPVLQQAKAASPPRPTTIVYGHTHVFDYYRVPDTAIDSWNLGSWLVEPQQPPPSTGFLGIDGTRPPEWFDVPA